MKKFLLSILVVTLSLAVFTGCSSTPAPKADDAKADAPATTTNGKIVVGLDENFPPMGFRDESGNIVGFDIDLAKAAAQKMGVAIEFQPIDWDSKELELKSKKVDVLWNGVSITDDRKKTMLFTKPYLKNRQIIMVKPDSTIATKADLKGKVVGVQKGSTAVDAINKEPDVLKSFKQLAEYPDNVTAFMDLSVGRVDAVVVDEVVAGYYITKNENKFKILDDNFGSEVYGVAMSLDNTDLNTKLQKGIDETIADGTAAEISKKWFGSDIVVK